MTTSLRPANSRLNTYQGVKVVKTSRKSPVRSFLADACHNSFLILLGEAAAVEESAARVVRRPDRWIFDSVLALAFVPGAGVLMRVLEQDGSESVMCGNGARAV